MKKILLYHLFPVNNWEAVTAELFRLTPFDRIVVHVSWPKDSICDEAAIRDFFAPFKIDKYLFSANGPFGEVDALRSFIKLKEYIGYDILTYLHSKGVTKPHNKNIEEWNRLMYYFVVERMDLVERAFARGYVTYGVNKSIPNPSVSGFRGSNYFYEGNFVNLNLRLVDLTKSAELYLEDDYYGVEGFWGKLAKARLGYSAFNSGLNHYYASVPRHMYVKSFNRLKYILIHKFYLLRSLLYKSKKVASDTY